MKPRSLVLLAILLILILIGISWFRRNVVPKIDDQIEHIPDTDPEETVADIGGEEIEAAIVSVVDDDALRLFSWIMGLPYGMERCTGFVLMTHSLLLKR